ncbi:MAG: hypothetical protein WCO18_02795 [bacterium]
MKIQAPSKKIISLIIVCLAIIIGILVVNRKDAFTGNSSLSYEVKDINTYNTDNASTTDSQSLNDLLGITDQASNSTDSADASSTNVSDLLARSLLSGLVSLSQNGDTSSDSEQNLATGLADQASQTFTYTEYTPDNLKIVSAPTKDSITFYASAVADVQNNILIGLANESADPANIKLKNITKVYKNAADTLYDLPVPIDLAASAINIINNYSIVSSVYADLDNSSKDPVLATIALKYFQDAAKSQRNNIIAMANYFRDNGIIFSSDDTGSYWNDFVTSNNVSTSSTIISQ